MALAYYQANCAGGNIIGCWDRDCIRGPCQWVKDRGYFDGTSWYIPEFAPFGLSLFNPIADWAWANGIPIWAVERFIWDNHRMPLSQSEMIDYMRLAGIPYCMEHAKVAAFIDSRPDIQAWANDCYAGTAWGCAVARGVIPWNTAAKVAVFYSWWENMHPPEFAQYGGRANEMICKLYPSSWTCQCLGAPTPTPPPLDCSTQGKYAWAAQVGLPVCVADLFCQQFGRLPTSVSELTSWGTQKGIRCADGSWNCSGCQAGGTQPPGTQPSPGPQPPVQCAPDQIALPVINKCVDKKTALLVGGGLALMLLVGGGRRR
jgi:hypothetical protein